ncbi:MAG: VCBS repeat-containing protein [Chloracidobacterium sp.]|nr:VCBS repeat-containing protein [Chloracidobacterium sp.]
MLVSLRFTLFISLATIFSLATVFRTVYSFAATAIDILPPAGSGSFGSHIRTLPNGNFVVTDPTFDIQTPNFVADAGAVYVFTRNGELISRITGKCQNDNLGSNGITVLHSGNFTINSPNVDLPVPESQNQNICIGGLTYVVPNVGTVTLGLGATGIEGVASVSNSFIGDHVNDRVGDSVALPNGDYAAVAIFWNGGRGAVSKRSGTVVGGEFVTDSNSVVGVSTVDFVGKVTVLPNGNYVVSTNRLANGQPASRLCILSEPCVGPMSDVNSLIGSPGVGVDFDGIYPLADGNYVLVNRGWNGERGAVTWVNGTTGLTGQVSSDNSLVGGTVRDFVGSRGVKALTNGGYVVLSEIWQDATATRRGAATFGPPGGISGVVSSVNSLIGAGTGSFSQSTIVPLTNGNYVVSLPNAILPGTGFLGAAIWGSGVTGISGPISISNSLYRGANIVVPLSNGNYVVASTSGFGAITWGNGQTGITGEISSANSMVGTDIDDRLGFGGVTPLANGNYVVSSPYWDNNGIQNAGAVTLCNGSAPVLGTVTTSNSIVGTKAMDQVGWGGAVALPNGNYVVRSDLWDNGTTANAGAVTFGNGATGVTGAVSELNSLVGSNIEDRIGNSGIKVLLNGNYVVTSISWQNKGAVTFGNGITGTSGAVSAANSIVGSTNDDRVGTYGNNNSTRVFADNTYAFHSANWDNGGIVDAGAVTLGKGNRQVNGTISSENSVRGTFTGQGTSLVFDYSTTAKYMVVGRGAAVSIFKYEQTAAPFDFDGDGKTDVGIFRPGPAEWWYRRSSDGQVPALQFGTSTDAIAPVDYTGDGKSDVAFFRPTTGEWFILRSEDGSFYSFPFGGAGDTPVPADYDGDGKGDVAVFRSTNNTWYIQRSSDLGVSIITFGASGDLPVTADYDGDGKSDIGIFRPGPGEWWYLRSSDGGNRAFQFGTSTDRTVVGDYTGDGKADAAFFRPTTGEWFILRSEDGSFYSFPFGGAGDTPVPGDYDGDGKTDAAVFRPSSATWFMLGSTSGTQIIPFGAATDRPIPNAFVR